MAELPKIANLPTVQKRPSQIPASSPHVQRPLPTPPNRKPVRSNPVAQNLVLLNPRITSNDDWCQSVTSYLQSVLNWVRDTVSWMGT